MKSKMLILAAVIAVVAGLLFAVYSGGNDGVVKAPGPIYDQNGDRVLDEDASVVAEMPKMTT